MGDPIKAAWCFYCDRQTLHQRTGYQVPHMLHAALSLFTFGLWTLVWALHVVLHAVFSDTYYVCGKCGQREGERRPSSGYPVLRPSPMEMRKNAECERND